VTALLETREVRCVYAISQGLFRAKRSLVAVDGVSLELRKGEILGLVGESGCGKSTLARMLLGLQRPTSGQVLIGNRPVEEFGRRELARRVQTVFQDPYSSLNPRKPVSAIVSLPLRVHGIGDSASREAAVAAMLDMVGLPRRTRDVLPSQLSGGQRQRVAIARALIARPEIVICDEPTSSLDVSVQAQILNLLRELRTELGLTYLFVSHNLAVIDYLADRVAVMRAGKIVEEGPTDTIMRAPGHPYTRALLASVLTPEPGLGIPAVNVSA
jgi:peptide/nickel transport system ATP-binding protein